MTYTVIITIENKTGSIKLPAERGVIADQITDRMALIEHVTVEEGDTVLFQIIAE